MMGTERGSKTRAYYRPLVQTGPTRPPGALTLVGGHAWFTQVEVMTRTGSTYIPAQDLPRDAQEALCANRAAICGLDMAQTQIMGILNVTPDSFSDGGDFTQTDAALNHAKAMVHAGATILDIGGESTRPGADFVPPEREIARTAPVIAALRAQMPAVISIDTRKGPVAQAALNAGANLVNDVAALGFDASLAKTAAQAAVPVCLMHAQGDPKTMQAAPSYDNVVLDVFDFLQERIDVAVAAGISRDQIIVDPGIGFGKSMAHNLSLLSHLSVFHSLGCPLLLGASRKRFIGTLTKAEQAKARMPGSVAIALMAAQQGAQILRVHDVGETKAALTMAAAINGQTIA